MLEDYTKFHNLLKSNSRKGIIALDLGLKSVGVAFTELGVNLPVPLKVIPYKKVETLLHELRNIVDDRQVGLIVIGANSNQFVIDLIEEIKKLNIPIALEDEFYTTKIANELLSEYGYKRKKRNQIDDMIAAKLILESFLAKLLN